MSRTKDYYRKGISRIIYSEQKKKIPNSTENKFTYYRYLAIYYY